MDDAKCTGEDKLKWANYSCEISRHMLFDEYGLMNNGKSRPTKLGDYEAMEALTSTCVVPIHLANDFKGVCKYLDPQKSKVVRRYMKGVGTGDIFQSRIEINEKGEMVYVTPTKEISLKRCSVALEKVKIKQIKNCRVSSASPTIEYVKIASIPQISVLSQSSPIPPTIPEPLSERQKVIRLIKETLNRTTALKEKYNILSSTYETNASQNSFPNRQTNKQISKHFIDDYRASKSDEAKLNLTGESDIGIANSYENCHNNERNPTISENNFQTKTSNDIRDSEIPDSVVDDALSLMDEIDLDWTQHRKSTFKIFFDMYAKSVCNGLLTENNFEDIPVSPCDAFKDEKDYEDEVFKSIIAMDL